MFGFRLLTGVLPLTALFTAPQPAAAAETRGFVVNWFHVAEYADPQGRDCPHGVNPGPEIYYRRELARIGKSQAEIDDYIHKFLDLSKFAETIPVVQMRGRIDGKPVDVYANPTSVPDPHILTVEGPNGYGFNLDGKDKPGDFIDPVTGEHGVDNQLYRVVGCINELKSHTLTDYAPLAVNYWNVVVEQMPAWLVEISGASYAQNGALQNSDDVTVGIYRAEEPPTKDSAGGLLAGLTFHADPNPRWQNTVHGRIRDGVLTTDIFDMNMLGDPFWMQEFHFKEARLRLSVAPNGTLKGYLGGYHAWFPYYWLYATGGWGVEATNNIDLPGLYYALKRLADAYPDPKTGENTAISTAYEVDAVPAFIVHEKTEPARAAAADMPARRVD